jgi:hypothetical protein
MYHTSSVESHQFTINVQETNLKDPVLQKNNVCFAMYWNELGQGLKATAFLLMTVFVLVNDA